MVVLQNITEHACCSNKYNKNVCLVPFSKIQSHIMLHGIIPNIYFMYSSLFYIISRKELHSMLVVKYLIFEER